jgi:hypothetical protein
LFIFVHKRVLFWVLTVKRWMALNVSKGGWQGGETVRCSMCCCIRLTAALSQCRPVYVSTFLRFFVSTFRPTFLRFYVSFCVFVYVNVLGLEVASSSPRVSRQCQRDVITVGLPHALRQSSAPYYCERRQAFIRLQRLWTKYWSHLVC